MKYLTYILLINLSMVWSQFQNLCYEFAVLRETCRFYYIKSPKQTLWNGAMNVPILIPKGTKEFRTVLFNVIQISNKCSSKTLLVVNISFLKIHEKIEKHKNMHICRISWTFWSPWPFSSIGKDTINSRQLIEQK